jgi:hypothetical protein
LTIFIFEGITDLIWTLETDVGELFATEFQKSLKLQLLMGGSQQ